MVIFVRGCLIFNPSYTDEGQEYVKKRLNSSFLRYGVALESMTLYATAGMDFSSVPFDFVVFWDKDVGLAKYLERNGVRVFNRAFSIGICDDKRKTYEYLLSDYPGLVPLIPTVFSRLAYRACEDSDGDFFARIESAFGYPFIVKENVGSLGKQVYLVKSREELAALHKRLFLIPHQFQRLMGVPGTDIRVYTVGGEAVSAYKRVNPSSFISNAAQGGVSTLIDADDALKAYAEAIAQALRLDFGAIDFLEEDGRYYFLEANSNAYFTAAERLGANIAERIAEHIILSVSKQL